MELQQCDIFNSIKDMNKLSSLQVFILAMCSSYDLVSPSEYSNYMLYHMKKIPCMHHTKWIGVMNSAQK